VISDLKKKYNMILSYETATARSVALVVIRPKPFSVWEVLIPIIFIFGYMKSKETREVFAQNVLFTKKLAMQAAFDMLKKDRTRESVMEQIRSKTREMIAAIPDGIYSAEIRREQLKEIDLLVDHYCRLLNSEGDDYDSLVFNAYRTPQQLTDFFEQLRKAEESVGRAAHNTLGSNADTSTLERMNAALRNIRLKFTEKIFNTRLQSQNARS
jgi:RNA processing factor Prp31